MQLQNHLLYLRREVKNRVYNNIFVLRHLVTLESASLLMFFLLLFIEDKKLIYEQLRKKIIFQRDIENFIVIALLKIKFMSNHHHDYSFGHRRCCVNSFDK